MKVDATLQFLIPSSWLSLLKSRYSSQPLFLSPCHCRGSSIWVALALRMQRYSSFPSSGQLISHESGYLFAQAYPLHQWKVGGLFLQEYSISGRMWGEVCLPLATNPRPIFQGKSSYSTEQSYKAMSITQIFHN